MQVLVEHFSSFEVEGSEHLTPLTLQNNDTKTPCDESEYRSGMGDISETDEQGDEVEQISGEGERIDDERSR